MQKCIAVTELRLGMFIVTFAGSWISHPFWRDNFLLETPADLARIHASGIKELWIDTAKGIDVGPSADELAAQAKLAATPVKAVLPPPPPRIAFDEEVVNAQKICARSKMAITAMFNDARMGQAVEQAHVNELVQDISNSVSRNPDAFISLARLKNVNEYTYMHSVAVCALMIALGRQLNLDEEDIREAGKAGLLHDIGKMAIPDEILNKPGKLTDAEFDIIRDHPLAGGKMLRESGVTGAVLDVCEHHHEKMDGTGYPHRMLGEQLSVIVRMSAICDVYDALTSDRCYKAGWEPAEAIRRMAEWKGHFDETVFRAFVKTIGIYPVGALVRLESGRIAVVLEQHKKSLLTPRVKVVMSARSRAPILHEVVDLSKFVGIDKIVAVESPDTWGIQDVNTLWSGLPA